LLMPCAAGRLYLIGSADRAIADFMLDHLIRISRRPFTMRSELCQARMITTRIADFTHAIALDPRTFIQLFSPLDLAFYSNGDLIMRSRTIDHRSSLTRLPRNPSTIARSPTAKQKIRRSLILTPAIRLQPKKRHSFLQNRRQRVWTKGDRAHAIADSTRSSSLDSAGPKTLRQSRPSNG